MLIRNLAILKNYVRKIKPQSGQNRQRTKFTQQELSMMGQNMSKARKTIEESFKSKYEQKTQSLQLDNQKKGKKRFQKKTILDRQRQFVNKQMPKPASKQQRITPQQMTLAELSSVRLNPQYLPSSYLRQAQKIFHKYGQTRLRQIADNFSALMNLRYREEKLDFDKYEDLKFERLQEKLPKQKQVQQIYLIGQQKIYEQNKNDENPVRKVDSDPFNPQISYTQNIVISYLLKRAPRSFSTAIRMMTQIKYKYPTFKPRSFLDFGGGLSAGACAFADIFDNNGQIYSVEPSGKMRKLAKYLTQGISIKHYENLGQMSTQVKQVDIVYAGYVLNELKPDLIQVYLEALYTKTKNYGFLVLVQYGSPFGSRLIHEARKWAIEKGMQIAAPCPHALKCPLSNSKSWCHFDQPSGIYPQNVFGKLPTDQAVKLQKFSYLILQKVEVDQRITQLQKHQPNITKDWDRIIYPILRRGQHVVVDICTKQGKFQRRVSAKSHGPQYRQAKKLRWGDFWRFGKRIPNRYRKERISGKRLW